MLFFFFSSRRRHTRLQGDWSSDVCSSDLVIAHLLGNLKVFQGAEHFNAYAAGLRTLGAPFFPRGLLLWVARIVLVGAVCAHIWAAIAVTRASWSARPVGDHGLEAGETPYAPRAVGRAGLIAVGYISIPVAVLAGILR